MPVDPLEVQKLIEDPRFQALGPEDQHANLTGFIQQQDPDGFGKISSLDQTQVAGKLLERYTPGFGSKVADVAEYVPVVGGAVTGYRAASRGEPARPLTGALIGSSDNPYIRAGQEAVRDVGELAAAEGAVKLAGPVIDAVTTKFAGTTIENALLGGATTAATRGTAGAAVDAAFEAGSLTAARQFAGAAARNALKERWVRRGLEQLTAGAAFSASQAVEGEIANGELPPLSDLLGTTLGAAALGIGIYGAGDLMRKFGVRSMEPIVATAKGFDPERFAGAQRNIAEIADAVRRASGGTLDKVGASRLVVDALTEPIEAVGQTDVLKTALRSNPELLGSEVGLHLLRTQRALTVPDIQFVDGPYLRVRYDDEAGHSITQDLTDVSEQKAFRERLAKGQVTVDHAVGDERSVLRAGIRPGEPVHTVVSPGGTLAVVPEASPFEGLRKPETLPAVISREKNLGDVVDHATRELRTDGRVSPSDLTNIVGHARDTMAHAESATSVEAINRLASEKASGVTYAAVDVRPRGKQPLKERVVPGTVDRVDARPGPFEIIVKRGATPKDVIVEAGAKVRPEQVRRVRTLEEARFTKDVVGLQRRAAAGAPPQLPAPPPPENVLLPEGRPIEVRPFRSEPPPVGTRARTTVNGNPVTVVGVPDVIGRAVVELPNGVRVRAPWNPFRNTFDIHDDVFTLPTREGRAPTLTREAPVATAEFRAQIQPGQMIHQSIDSVSKLGARPSIEVLAVEGDRVLVRMGDVEAEVPLDQVAHTIESGAGRLAFDMTKAPTDQLRSMGERVIERVRERSIIDPKSTPEQLARDRQLANELYAFDTQRAGQTPSPATAAKDANIGLAEKKKARAERPIDERTKSKSDLVKGCKP